MTEALTTGLEFMCGRQQEETKKTQNRKSARNFSESDEDINFECELSSIICGDPKKPSPKQLNIFKRKPLEPIWESKSMNSLREINKEINSSGQGLLKADTQHVVLSIRKSQLKNNEID